MSTLVMKDLPLLEDLSEDAACTIRGGMINHRDEVSPNPPPDDAHGPAGPLHPGDNSTNIWWPHGYW
jgi:hypothetical protein